MPAQGATSQLRDRLIGLVIFAPSMTVLALARWLTPDPTGVGTHRQLGLASCVVLDSWGIPCPMCGMTTTFSHMAHLEPLSALINQPFGVVLFGMTLFMAVIGLMEMVRPQNRIRAVVKWTLSRDRALAGILLGSMFAAWLYKAAVMREMLP